MTKSFSVILVVHHGLLTLNFCSEQYSEQFEKEGKKIGRVMSCLGSGKFGGCGDGLSVRCVRSSEKRKA